MQELGVAEAKARFSELLDRVAAGERFVVSRRGRPAAALLSPSEVPATEPIPKGLAAGAGALADWDDLPAVIDEIYAARERSKDRAAPVLE